MKGYLLLFLSTTLLLFSLPKGSMLNGTISTEQGTVKKKCAAGVLKRPCTRKCLRHQTHSEKRETGTVLTDCSQTYIAVLNVGQQPLLLPLSSAFVSTLSSIRKPLSPYLKIEPEPPQIA